jgi:dTDP-4-dehydrorhamnose reductase
MRILLLGGGGQVGEELRALALPDGVALVAPTRAALDVMHARKVADAIASADAPKPWGAAACTAATFAVNDAAPPPWRRTLADTLDRLLAN